MDITLQQVGRRLYERRKQLRMTQEELAERVGITAQTISTAELGKKAMRADTIIRVCAALDISADYLLFGHISSQDSTSSPRRFPSSPQANTATWRTP